MIKKNTVWITYAWADNQSSDVDFIAQELEDAGLNVKLDRWTIEAGKKLWPQIEKFIQDPSHCDAWLMYATQASLGSEPCKEEYAYALDRALHTRGGDFPVMALFPTSANPELIPAGIRVRLHVSLTDPDWKERIVAATEGRGAEITRKRVDPFVLTVHDLQSSHGPEGPRYAIEMRPRAGTWAPFFAAILASEREPVAPSILRKPAGRIPNGNGTLSDYREGIFNDRLFLSAGEEATPTMSYFLFCKQLPTQIFFGVADGPPQYSGYFSQPKL